jgi:8-amino-7-oxononanoate synthase
VEELGLNDRVLATVHTGGKALGSGGAWIAGSRTLCEVLVNRARSFIFSTAPMPVLAAALNGGLDLLERQPARRFEVHRKAALVRHNLAELDIRTRGESPIVPIVAGTNEAALAMQAGLQAAGFDVRAVRPPTVPPGTARLRVTVRYPVSDDDLLRFVTAVVSLQSSLASQARS